MRIQVINKPKKPWQVTSIRDSRNKNINRNNKKWEVIKSNGVTKQHIYSFHALTDAVALAQKKDGYTVRAKLTYKGKGITSKEEKVFLTLCHYIDKLHKEAA